MKDAADLLRRALDAVNRERYLGDVLVVLRRGETGFDISAEGTVAAGQVHEGNCVTPRLRDASERVLYAGTALGGEHAYLPPGGELPAVSVSSLDSAAFLAENDRPYTDLGYRFDKRVRREARHPLDAFLFQTLGHKIEAVHLRKILRRQTCLASMYRGRNTLVAVVARPWRLTGPVRLAHCTAAPVNAVVLLRRSG